jgi:hypothetical protein
VSSTLASCTDAPHSARCSATRDGHSRPGRAILYALFARSPPSFLAFLARQRSWVFLRPSQVCSRGRVLRHFWRSGPTCRFVRRASDPIDFRRADRSAPGGDVVGRGLLLVRDVRLLGFAPVCDPHPTATSRGIDPASGFASCRVVGTCLRMRSGSTPTTSSASGIPRIACSCANRSSLSAHGFSTRAPIRTGARAVPSAY